jgi:HAE1 family hydrophobic/amphiphilic exporter-1
MGLSATQISSLIKNSVAGSKATTFRYQGEEYDTFVFMRESDRDTLDGIKSIMIATPAGEKVPLGNLIEIKNETGPSTIERLKQQRVVYLNCKPEGRR